MDGRIGLDDERCSAGSRHIGIRQGVHPMLSV